MRGRSDSQRGQKKGPLPDLSLLVGRSGSLTLRRLQQVQLGRWVVSVTPVASKKALAPAAITGALTGSPGPVDGRSVRWIETV